MKHAWTQFSAAVRSKNPCPRRGEWTKAADGLFYPCLACLIVLVVAMSGCAPVSLKPRSVECTLAVVITQGISGCEPTPLMPATLDDEGKRFSPAPGKANIYVVRPSIVGGRFPWNIHVDGQPAGLIAAHTYLLLEIEPGKHGVTAITSENQHSIVVSANRGENHYLEVVSRVGWTQSRAELRTLPQEQGKAAIRDTMRAASLHVAQRPAEIAAGAPGISSTYLNPNYRWDYQVFQCAGVMAGTRAQKHGSVLTR